MGLGAAPAPQPICSLFIFLHLSITSQINTPRSRGGRGHFPASGRQDPALGAPSTPTPGMPPTGQPAPGGHGCHPMLRPCPPCALCPMQGPGRPLPTIHTQPTAWCCPLRAQGCAARHRSAGVAALGPVAGLFGRISWESRDAKHNRVLAPAQVGRAAQRPEGGLRCRGPRLRLVPPG